MNTEIIDGILTFDELMEDEYYSSEIEKYVQQRLEDIKNSHSDVKGGKEMMDGQVQQNEGENNKTDAAQAENQQAATATVDPTVERTDTAQQGKEEAPKEPAREMTAEQFELYNETLRRVSKTAKAGLPDRYNAFEDAEIKTLVRRQVMQGEKPSVKDLAASVVTRLTHKDDIATSDTDFSKATEKAGEVINLKAENALLKAGINADRIDAAKRLFIAEGADFNKISEFVAKYPEWQAHEGRVVFSKAPPLADRTAPNPQSQPVMNDFEKVVKAYRKKAGLE